MRSRVVSDGVGGIQPGPNDLVYRPNRVFGTDTLRAAVGPTLYVTALAKGRLLPVEELIARIEAWDCA